jgi:ABC-type phosphate transport system substrate-binding protein
MTRSLPALLFLFVIGLLSPVQQVVAGDEPIAIVVHPGVPVQSLSAAELRSIYKRDTQFWSNGDPIRPFALPPESDVRQAFDLAVLGMDPPTATKYWIDQRVRGGAPPPRGVPNASLLARVITSLTGAIAYLPQSSVPQGARIVAVIRGGTVTRAMASAPFMADGRLTFSSSVRMRVAAVEGP